ncbi:hypothetical protein [Spirosoma utsteinense]|uniref:Type VII secretion system (Wss) protein ESAT-6 n=1 Tax=Spirosoma utsteinense TaxID=2585773 RepID=A0ABR6W440_9BACT|nr:hypothetical protein [Spirosoma utsteinense]MBC3788171.1 hypothetical protein [Spirosoma utsteinense]MBC3790480.1 hypothetical protein [Spirosoma utsteinense]
MALDQHAANLVTTTVNAFNGDTTSISPIDGISLIDSWISALSNSDQDTDSVAGGLNELRTELQSSNPDGARIQQLLGYMVDQANQVASSADAEVKETLDPLVNALQGFRQQLGGSEKMAAMNTQPSDTVMPGESGGQAPMTSTVGGESTNSGAGASTLREDDDDQLTNRNGGTMDSGSAPAAEATTGSAGAEQQDGGSYGSGYGTGSDGGGDDYSTNSGTQRSGVSGGTAESGSAASGGRSQY